jgi:large subunit ribosomal protein L25
MADTVVLEVQERTKHGTNASRQLRKTGAVPGVIYGHEEATIPLSVPGDALYKAVRHGVRVYDVKLKSSTQKVLLRDVQWDPLGHDILHVDFYRVRADEKVTIEVKVELRGVPPGIAAGGALVQPIHNLTVECLIISIPESIKIAIHELQLDQSIKVRDLKLPEGVVVKNDPDAIIVQVSPKVVEEEAAVVPVAEQAEPEVIGRVKEEGAEETEEKK